MNIRSDYHSYNMWNNSFSQEMNAETNNSNDESDRTLDFSTICYGIKLFGSLLRGCEEISEESLSENTLSNDSTPYLDSDYDGWENSNEDTHIINTSDSSRGTQINERQKAENIARAPSPVLEEADDASTPFLDSDYDGWENSDEDADIINLSDSWEIIKTAFVNSVQTSQVMLNTIFFDDFNSDKIKIAKQNIHLLAESLQKKSVSISDENLILLFDQATHLIQNRKIAINNTKNYKENFVQLILSHPRLARTFIRILITSLGNLSDKQVASACRVAIDPILDQILPIITEESQAQRISAAVFEVLGTYFLCGPTAAVTTGGVSVFKEIAPKTMQVAAEAGAFAILANKAGLSLPSSFNIGVGTTLLLSNAALLKEVTKDLHHTWKIYQKNPLRIIPQSIFFVKNNINKNLFGIVLAIRNGSKKEAIIRIATTTLAIVGVSYGIGTLTLSISLFYLVNKSYQIKYIGKANLENPLFRAFVVEQFNKISHEEGEGVNALCQILLKENSELKEICNILQEPFFSV